MKVYFAFAPLVLALLLPVSLRAQNEEGPLNRKQFPRLNQIGFTFGAGSNRMKLNELNQRLADLQIATLEPELGAIAVSLHGRFTQGFEASMDVNIGFEGVRKQNAALDLLTSSFGGTFYRSLLQTNRFHILFALGYRMTNMRLEYNADRAAPTNFTGLFAPPSNAIDFRILSQTNHCVPIGARFQYRLRKQEPAGAGEGRVGFDVGYNYGVRTSPWSKAGSYNAIANMPTVKPDHIYFLVNVSAYFNR